MPCSNCRRAQIPCIFPAPGRAPRRPRPKDPNAPSKQPSSERELELMKRLRKLEGIVEELSGQIELEAVRHPGSSAASPDHLAGHDHEGIRNIGAHRMGTDAASVSGSSHGPASPAQSSGTGSGVPSGKLSSGAGHLKRTPTDVSKQFGRLVLNDKGVTRYVSSGFWSSINDEVRTCPVHSRVIQELTWVSSWTKYVAKHKKSPTRIMMTLISKLLPSPPSRRRPLPLTNRLSWDIALPMSTSVHCIPCRRKFPSYGRFTSKMWTQFSKLSMYPP